MATQLTSTLVVQLTKKVEGGQAEGYDLEIGSGSFIPGFEEQLEGMKVDEEKDVAL
ncbi:FKBP-type peptidyl-prolyl cis-trans isomerase [Staphylococcus aureus]